MNEDITPQNSVIESDHSRSSEVALIGNLFPKEGDPNADNRGRKYSRKYNVTEDHIEEERNPFKWMPERTELSEELKKRLQKKSSHIHIDPTMSTLESDKTSSSYTASDFTNNVYTRNGYIRGTNGKKYGQDSTIAFKYNEFSNLISSFGTGRNFPVEIKLDVKETKKEEKQQCLDEEHGIYLILGGIQMMLGILMAVFGVLVIAHDSSLSNSGSGLWGGAVAMFSGLMGILAGLKGCYSTVKDTKTSRTLLTIFFGLCMVSFALSNLVVVLSATGLIRDVRRTKNQATEFEQEENLMNWPPILADVGLILAAALQCVAAVFSAYKCYKKVCPCLTNGSSGHSDTISHTEKYKVESKERFVNHWLGQQFQRPKKNKYEGQNNLIPWGAPNVVLLPPPPPMIKNCQIPILTFLQAPSSVYGSGQIYPTSLPCCCRHENRYMTTPHPIVQEKRISRRKTYIQPDNQPEGPVKTRYRTRKRERRASLPTAEEVAKTYTGLDREIAEEFIAIAMEKGGRSRRNSYTEFANY